MRRAAIITLLAACGARPAPVAAPPPPPASPVHAVAPAPPPGAGDGPEAPPPEPPPRRPLPELATTGRFHLIVVDEGQARCEVWDVVPDAADHGAGALVRRWSDGAARTELSYSFESDGARLRVVGAWRETRHGDAVDTVTGMGVGPCGVELVARRAADRLDVSGAAWFPEAASCAAALAAREPVATDFSGCLVSRRDLAAEVEARGRDALVARLRDGGALWALEEPLDAAGEPTGALTCAQIDVVAGEPDDGAGTLSGSFHVRVVDDEGNRGVRGTRFVYRGDGTIDLLGPGESWTSADGTRGWASGTGCLHTTSVGIVDEDTVEIDAPYHLTLAACERARDAERERRAWLPSVSDATRAVAVAGTGLPGC